jgi:hypothetical protein
VLNPGQKLFSLCCQVLKEISSGSGYERVCLTHSSWGMVKRQYDNLLSALPELSRPMDKRLNNFLEHSTHSSTTITEGLKKKIPV